jgi:hypothetical protein
VRPFRRFVLSGQPASGRFFGTPEVGCSCCGGATDSSLLLFLRAWSLLWKRPDFSRYHRSKGHKAYVKMQPCTATPAGCQAAGLWHCLDSEFRLDWTKQQRPRGGVHIRTAIVEATQRRSFRHSLRSTFLQSHHVPGSKDVQDHALLRMPSRRHPVGPAHRKHLVSATDSADQTAGVCPPSLQ